MDRDSRRFSIWPGQKNNFATVENERILLNLLYPLNESNSGCMHELVSDSPSVGPIAVFLALRVARSQDPAVCVTHIVYTQRDQSDSWNGGNENPAFFFQNAGEALTPGLRGVSYNTLHTSGFRVQNGILLFTRRPRRCRENLLKVARFRDSKSHTALIAALRRH